LKERENEKNKKKRKKKKRKNTILVQRQILNFFIFKDFV